MKKELSANLQALSQGSADRTKMARLREALPDIEAAIKAGVTRTAIRRILKEDGLDMSAAFFSNALYRARQSTKRNQLAGSIEPSPTVARTPLASPSFSDLSVREKESELVNKVDPPSMRKQSPSGNPIDIRAIRNEPVDLYALSQLVKKDRLE